MYALPVAAFPALFVDNVTASASDDCAQGAVRRDYVQFHRIGGLRASSKRFEIKKRRFAMPLNSRPVCRRSFSKSHLVCDAVRTTFGGLTVEFIGPYTELN